MLDEPTTVPDLGDSRPLQFDLRTDDDEGHEDDELGAARGILIGVLMGFAVICAIWGFVLLLR